MPRKRGMSSILSSVLIIMVVVVAVAIMGYIVINASYKVGDSLKISECGLSNPGNGVGYYGCLVKELGQSRADLIYNSTSNNGTNIGITTYAVINSSDIDQSSCYVRLELNEIATHYQTQAFNVGDYVQTNISASPGCKIHSNIPYDPMESSIISSNINTTITESTIDSGKTYWYGTWGFRVGWMDQDCLINLIDNVTITFSLVDAKAIYGDYSNQVNNLFNDSEYQYKLESISNSGESLGNYGFDSSRFLFYDTFNPENPGGVIELNSSSLDVYIPSSIDGIGLVNISDSMNNISDTIDISSYDLTCKRDCGKLNESIDIMNGELCCDNLVPVNVQNEIYVCGESY